MLVFPQMLTLRPLVVDGQNVVLGGNMRLRALETIAQMSEADLSARLSNIRGFKSHPKKKEITAYWQRYLDKPECPVLSACDLTPDQVKEFIIKDNISYGVWDWDELGNLWDSEDLADWGLDVWQDPNDDVGVATEDVVDDKYTAKVEIPHYEPTGEQPLLSSLFDTSKVQQLIDGIDRADVPDDIKDFLRLAAYRHTKFYYSVIANYYAHAPKDVQKLMEDSALVIIDIKDAIKNGFVVMSKEIDRLEKTESDDEE